MVVVRIDYGWLDELDRGVVCDVCLNLFMFFCSG